MCGIVGVGCFTPGGLWFTQETMFRQLLLVDSLRGIDGAGIVRISKTGEADWRKTNGNGFDLLRCEDVVTWLGKAVSECDKILIGHNRFASVGKRTSSNAHPFEHAHITLVHNGFVSNLSEFGKKPKQFEVDSEGLTFAIAKRGILPVLTKLKGAYSIVFFDSLTKTLNFCRNKDRPMYYSYNEDTKKLLFGSEQQMLVWIRDRGTAALEYQTIQELPEHLLLTISENGEISRTPYEPPAAPFYTVMSQSKEESGYEWDYLIDPVIDTKPRPPAPALPKTPLETPTTSNVTSLYRDRGGKAFEFPTQLFGFKRGDKIQFVGIEFEKISKTQEQYRILGGHPQYDRLEIRCWVKTKEVADELVEKASMIEATVRSLQRELDGKPVIFVCEPRPLYGDSKIKESRGLLLLPNKETLH